jgi:hypothetical protein
MVLLFKFNKIKIILNKLYKQEKDLKIFSKFIHIFTRGYSLLAKYEPARIFNVYNKSTKQDIEFLIKTLFTD